jgi:hypothetical protein
MKVYKDKLINLFRDQGVFRKFGRVRVTDGKEKEI